MSAFENFKKQSTFAQPVETKPGSWKDHLDSDTKYLYNLLSAVKGASLVVIGAAAVTAAPALLLMSVAGAVFYSSVTCAQAFARTQVEEGIKNNGSWDTQHPKPVQFLKNIARYAIQPF